MFSSIFIGIILILHVNHGFLLENVKTVHIYVSPNGSDNNTGTDLGNPVKTIEKALLKSDEPGRRDKDIFIELTTGYYELESTLRVHNIRPRKLTIRAYQGQEVHVIGGKRIKSSAFKSVIDAGSRQRLPSIARNKVLQVRLSDVGITDLGTLQTFGFHSKHLAPLEIFENEKPLTLARYPNKDYININQNYSDGRSFTYLSDRPKQWHNEHDVWAHGFWMWSWADLAIKIQHLDPGNKNITLASKTKFGLRPGHYNAVNPTAVRFNRQGGYFRFVNVMSELDEPGEYFVDRENGVLYVWPSKDAPYTEKDQIHASIVPTCIDIIWSSSNIVLEGFVVEACRQNGLHANKVQNLTITRMKIQNTGSDSISCKGNNIKVNLCDIRNGDGGISISGGDQTTLTPSGNEVSDNIISYFGRVEYVGSDGISVDGVGIHVHHNTLFKGSYKGIDIRGNDHIFEYNHISKMCLKASDCGAIQSGRHFSWRGNVIRYNHIQDTRRLVPGADVRGIMLDDQLSGVLIEHNVFNHNDVHVNIGGGRDNIVHQNIFYNTTQYSMQLDARGANGKWHTSDMLRYLNKIPYTNSLWSKRYPKLASIMSEHNPGNPVGNQVTENIFLAVGYPHFQTYGKKFQSDWFNVSNNIYISDVGSFSAPRYGNFKPGCLLKDFVNQTNFQDPVLPNQVGPRNKVGPIHILETIQPDTGYLSGNPPSTSNCVVKPPAKQPTPVYLPDGSMPNTLYKVPESKGCWFSFDKCPNHQELEKSKRPTSNQFYRNTQAEQNDHSGTNETVCLNKVSEMVNKCGSGSSFAVIYGPTGAMTLGGGGCYFARYHCPRTGWNATGFFEDKYADQKLNGAHDESVCLSRANAQWKWCGSSQLYPLVSIFKPTGHFRAAGAGCWIKHEKCPADATLKHMFYDGFGATNLQTDDNMDSCLSRAEYFWHHCGNHPEYKVTAYFRPRSVSATYPF
ncbi:uncharacterized protein LOC127711025 isoform X1 [Mytilus californianus]|uniref:uncharacterized protein LOC127711025 isoform X1 n=2 Tax=Mytilus californianus TaxID=6549 RepID=UPI00224831AA|nr:uncharacterized protein LOC127711025 isoform X1 [Mytilus californianus]